MKRIIKTLSILLLLGVIFCALVACEKPSEEPTHTHEYNQKVIESKYLESNATCTEAAKYYYSCSCGEKGEVTFDEGRALEHIFTNYVSDNNAECEKDGTKTALCDNNCGKDHTILDEGSALEHSFTNYVSDNNATYEKDGIKTALCDNNCGKEHTISDEGTKLQSSIRFKTLTVGGYNASGVVPNAVNSFSFVEEIETIGVVKYVVSMDEYGIQQSATKTIPLNEGDNVAYVIELEDDEVVNTYKVTIRRRPIYTVSFDAQGGTLVSNQYVEEGSLATYPIVTSRVGYTFNKWDYDFSQAITQNTTIKAEWNPNTDTPYTVKYYLENLEDNGYTLIDEATENLKGLTDTTANAEIKTFKHFTFNTEMSNASGNIDAYGTLVLNVYYTRNQYTVVVNKSSDSGSVSGAGIYKYGTEITVEAAPYLGYKVAFRVDGYSLGTNKYTFVVDQAVTFLGDFTVLPEMEHFDFLSNFNVCQINGLKNSSLTQVVIPDYVTTVARGAFRGYTSLESVTIGSGVTSIGDQAFYNSGIKSITIPNNVESIGDQAFYGCNSLIEVTINADNVIAFKQSESIKNVVIGDGVKVIGTRAFEGCTALDSVTIGNGAESTGYGTFVGCISLKSVTIGSNVTTIGARTFEGCTSLDSITIPNCVKTIGFDAFEECSSLSKVKYLGSLEQWLSIEFATSINSISSCPLSNCADLYVNGTSLLTETTLTVDDTIAFSGCTSLESVTISDNVTSIGNNTFKNCTSLKNVTVGKSVTNIGYCAFNYCTSLKSITIPDSVKTIGESAFSDTALENIIIPDSVKTIGNYAFDGCTSLKNITIGKSVNPIGSYVFNGCDSLTDVTINANNVTAFISGCTSLESVTIGDNVTRIWTNAFDGCTSLKNVVIGKSVKTIGSYAFKGTALESITIPDSVESIGDGVFYQCNLLESVIMGSNVTSIGSDAFSLCSSLKSITIPDGVGSIGSGTFELCTSLESVTIGDNVTSIGDNAFDGCTSLKNVIIGKSVTSIGYCAFNYCTSLKSIIIPDSVQTIGNNAFYQCYSLVRVVIGSGVTSIGDYAFFVAPGHIYYNGTAEMWSKISIGSGVFDPEATRYYYVENESDVPSTGNYWHYVDGVPTKW